VGAREELVRDMILTRHDCETVKGTTSCYTNIRVESQKSCIHSREYMRRGLMAAKGVVGNLFCPGKI